MIDMKCKNCGELNPALPDPRFINFIGSACATEKDYSEARSKMDSRNSKERCKKCGKLLL